MKAAMQRLNDLIKEKNSRLCITIGPTSTFTLSDAVTNMIYEYFDKYIEAIYDIVPAIKINIAEFEKEAMEDIYWNIATMAKESGLFVIADVNRSGPLEEAKLYAQEFLSEDSPFDAITVNAYYGTDGVMPFLNLAKENSKGVFVVVKTLKESSQDIQNLELFGGMKVYEAVAGFVQDWSVDISAIEIAKSDDKYHVVGAVLGTTNVSDATNLISYMPNVFRLLPDYDFQKISMGNIAPCFDKGGSGTIVCSSTEIVNAYKQDRWKKEYSAETWAEALRDEAIRETEEINSAIAE